ncbi:hypothetical protein ACJJTC_009179 [Scirpophaga incertulas]
MPPPTTKATTPSSEVSDADEELRKMEEDHIARSQILAPKPQRPTAGVARPATAHAHATAAGTQARAANAPVAGTSRPAAATGAALRKVAGTPARPATAPAHANTRNTKTVAGGAARTVTPPLARPGSAPATAKEKTPTNAPTPAAPSSGKNVDHQETVEKQTTMRVVPQQVGEDELTTPRLPTTYAEKFKRITTHNLAVKIGIQDPRLVKQKSLESIQLTKSRPPTTGSQDTLQLITFDRSARTVSPSNLRPTAPTPFPSMARQDDPDDAAKQQQQRESRKRQLEADDTTATQPARPKMQPPAIPTIITTPPGTQNITQPQESEPSGPHTLMAAANGPEGPTRRKRRGGKGKGKRKTEAVTDAAETAPTTASTKTPAPAEVRTQRASKRPRSTGAEPRIITEPPEVPVVAASTQRTKAKPATSDTAPMTTEQTTANIIEDVLSLLRSAFVSLMTGESLTAVISRGLMELWRLLSRAWIPN